LEDALIYQRMALAWLDLCEFVSGYVRGSERIRAVLSLLALT